MEETTGQLRMIWPNGRSIDAQELSPPVGYTLREATAADLPNYVVLMETVALGTWDEENIANTFRDLLSHSWFVVVHDETGVFVASSMTLRRPMSGSTRDCVEVGWIAAHPDHAGRRLGRLVVAATLDVAITTQSGCIYLQTDDYHLPAIKTYLDLGFVPYLWAPDMAQRWSDVHGALSMPISDSSWVVPPDVA